MTTQSTHPYHLIVKPVGAKCNLDCNYCYYLRKEERYEPNATMQMSEALLETYTQQYIESQPEQAKHIEFSWQGGEPTLRGLDFYIKAVEFQKKYARPGMTISNNFQTNGTLINDRWATFFKQNNFLIGISIDGSASNHNSTRPDLKGNDSLNLTLRGLAALKKHGVTFNTLSVVHKDNANQAKETYRELKALGSTVIQFQPCVEHPSDQRSDKDWSLTPHQWGHFLCDVFDEWKKEDVGKIHIQFFENTLGVLAGQPSQMCFHSELCGQQMMLEHDGSIYSCDHYSYDDYKVGHLTPEAANSNRIDAIDITAKTAASNPFKSNDLGEIACSDTQKQFGTDKWTSLPQQCRDCHFRPFCNGGCPKDRTAITADQQPGLNHLCVGYKQFFLYSMPYFGAMLESIQQGYSAAMYPIFLK